MKNKAEKSSNIICPIYEQIDPSFYSFDLHQHFIILCQSSDNASISKFLCNLLKISLCYFLNNIDLFQQGGANKKQQFHKQKIANLIVSCRQQIQQKKLEGSCAFAIGYLFDNKLYCFRSEGIQMFLLDQELQRAKAINGSFGYKYNKRNRNKNIEKGYFTSEMPSIKAEYLYQGNDLIKKHIYFEKINLDNFKHSTEICLRVLVGCSETFDLITPQLLFKHFFGNNQKIDFYKVKQVLEQARKQIKTIHRQDLSLVSWKISDIL